MCGARADDDQNTIRRGGREGREGKEENMKDTTCQRRGIATKGGAIRLIQCVWDKPGLFGGRNLVICMDNT